MLLATPSSTPPPPPTPHPHPRYMETCPCTILTPLFLIFPVPPLWGEVVRIDSPFFKKGGLGGGGRGGLKSIKFQFKSIVVTICCFLELFWLTGVVLIFFFFFLLAFSFWFVFVVGSVGLVVFVDLLWYLVFIYLCPFFFLLSFCKFAFVPFSVLSIWLPIVVVIC